MSDNPQVSAEQQARDLLERCGVEDAQSFSAGDVVELANLIAGGWRKGTSMAKRAYSDIDLDGLLPGTIVLLSNGLAAQKRDGTDWFMANDETDEFSGECIAMNGYALPAIVLWEPGDETPEEELDRD